MVICSSLLVLPLVVPKVDVGNALYVTCANARTSCATTVACTIKVTTTKTQKGKTTTEFYN